MTPERPSLDRRVARTRRTILAAFAELVQQRGYDTITVQDVILAADVGRSTFYQHFRCKEDLILSRLTDLGYELDTKASALPASAAASARVLAFSLPMFEHGQEQRGIIRALLADPAGHAAAMRAVEKMLIATVQRELAAALPRGAQRVRAEVHAHQIIGAFSGLFLWWIADRTYRLDCHEVNALFMDLMRPGLTLLLAGTKG